MRGSVIAGPTRRLSGVRRHIGERGARTARADEDARRGKTQALLRPLYMETAESNTRDMLLDAVRCNEGSEIARVSRRWQAMSGDNGEEQKSSPVCLPFPTYLSGGKRYELFTGDAGFVR